MPKHLTAQAVDGSPDGAGGADLRALVAQASVPASLPVLKVLGTPKTFLPGFAGRDACATVGLLAFRWPAAIATPTPNTPLPQGVRD